MHKWLRKTLVVTISALTFGLVSPPASLQLLDTKADKNDQKSNLIEENKSIAVSTISLESFEDKKSNFVKYAMAQAELQALEKFGNKIAPVIEDEFRLVILPEVENVIASISNQYPEENLTNLIISEQPSGGISEKIFHIYDKTSGKDVIRFHVRRDHPPQEGYWFNFHYHTHHDSFQSHNEIGKIYWDRNTPPKWMS